MGPLWGAAVFTAVLPQVWRPLLTHPFSFWLMKHLFLHSAFMSPRVLDRLRLRALYFYLPHDLAGTFECVSRGDLTV